MSEALNETLLEEEPFVVTDDQTAEWCLKKIREAEEEKQSWSDFYKEQLRKISETCDATIANMMHYLEVYFGTVKHKVTETEENYRLQTGKLVMKKPTTDFEQDEESLLAWLKKNHPEFIRTKESVDWSSLKKTLMVVGDAVADENGEVIPCITVVEKPAEFKIAK